jgi:hypothetical protein
MAESRRVKAPEHGWLLKELPSRNTKREEF